MIFFSKARIYEYYSLPSANLLTRFGFHGKKKNLGLEKLFDEIFLEEIINKLN